MHESNSIYDYNMLSVNGLLIVARDPENEKEEFVAIVTGIALQKQQH
jgi:hypothetical protein